MQEAIFKPKYPAQLTLGALVFAPIEFYVLWQILSGKDTSPENIFAAVLFGSLLAIPPLALVKRIVFRANGFTIEKYVWPAKTIDYADVTDVGKSVIKTRKGDLSFRPMLNADEVNNLLADLIKQGKINRHQLDNKVDLRAALFRKALMPAGMISFILWGVAFFVFPYEDSFFRDLGIIGFFIPVYVIVYQILKNRADNQ